MSRFRIAFALALVFVPSYAMGWEFSADERQGKVRSSVPGTEVAFSCFRTGTAEHDATSLVWEIEGADLSNDVAASTGEVVYVGLALDDNDLGDGPFVRRDDQKLATALPRSLPFLTEMRGAKKITLTLGARNVELPLDDLDDALSELTDWCDTPETTPSEPLVTVACDAEDGPTLQTICTTPELTELENRLLSAVETKTQSLEERQAINFGKEQESWIEFRKNCATDASCIENATKARLALVAPPPTAAQAPAATSLTPRETTRQTPQATAVLGGDIKHLQPAELSGVIWNQKDVQIKLLVEVVRIRPDLADDPNVLNQWARLALNQNNAQAGGTEVARSHLLRSVQANPKGPFVIGQLVGVPFPLTDFDGGAFIRPQGQRTNGVGRIQLSVPGIGSIELRARSQLDMSRLPAVQANADYIKSKQNLLVSGTVYQIDEIQAAVQSGGRQFVARGQVRFAGVFERSNQNNVPFNPQSLLALFQPQQTTPPPSGLTGAAQVLGLTLLDGKVVDNGTRPSNGSDQAGLVNELVRWAALRKEAPVSLTDQLRSLAFFTLATERERNAVIDPFYLRASNNQKRFNFDPLVDEFERAELLEKVDNTLWPVVSQRLPDLPIEVIATRGVTLGEYDRSLGGFPLSFNGDSFSIARQGRFPALSEVPDFLPLSIDDARQLIAFLEGNGRNDRRLTIAFQYQIKDTGDISGSQTNTQRQTEGPQIEPLALSLHGYRELVEGEQPLAQKIMEFDLANYRGPERPVADEARVAYWAEVDASPISTTDQVIYAAMGAADSPTVGTRLAQSANKVRQANDFDRQGITQQVLAELNTAAKPEMLKLEGQIYLGQYNQQTGKFRVESVNFAPTRGEGWHNGPRMALSQPELLAEISADPKTAAILVQGPNQRPQVGLTLWATPDLSSDDGRNVTLFLTPTRIVIRALGDDGTGYSPAHVEIRPEPAAMVRPGEISAEVPQAVALDSDYLDLLTVRDTPDSIDDATYLRMMHDRRLREAKAREIGLELDWGAFFVGPYAGTLNPVQERQALARFKTWTEARAEALPDQVYLQSAGIGGGGQLACWTSSSLQNDQWEQAFPAGIPGGTLPKELARHALMLAVHARDAGRTDGKYVMPQEYRVIVGTPALSKTRLATTDAASSACGYTSGRREQITLEGTAHRNALIEVRGAIRQPLPREPRLIFRDFGTVEVTANDAKGVVINFDVTHSSLFEVVADGQTTRIVEQAKLTEASLPQLASSLDVFGIEPGDGWADALKTAAGRLPGAVMLEEDGPPSGLRVVTQNTIFGPEQQFTALRNGHFLIDTAKSEAIALIRENERDPERLIAVGSYRVFDASAASQDALIGALLQKYGSEPDVVDDQRFRGPRPGKTLSWGARAGCLPAMQDEIRPSLQAFTSSPQHNLLANLARQFRAPQLQYSDQRQMLFETCKPVVWAAVGEDSQGKLHLIVWSLDLRIMNEVAQMPDLTVKADGAEGSQSLIENAAEIDL